MKIAVEGCAHGELEKIYETIAELENRDKIKVDLLLCCGDFQATRNMEDLQTVAAPQKYLNMCSFYKYYSGELIAPMLTIFIGGNHEASNYMQELPYGGWVAPNIYYLGYAGAVCVNGIRIAGLSGIYKSNDYLRGRFEFSPYTESTKRSVYHVRQFEVFRLKQMSGAIDIFMSHDWPKGIYNHGNKAQLGRFKPFLKDEMDRNELGSRPCEDLLYHLKPTYWFSAHLHCKFVAVVQHHVPNETSTGPENAQDEKEQDEKHTKFLALDKCLPRRRFLQILDIDSKNHPDDGEKLRFEYDLEWLTILSLTNNLLSVKEGYYYLPNAKSTNGERYDFTPTEEEKELIRIKFERDLRIPENFCRTVEPFDPSTQFKGDDYIYEQPKSQINPQSQRFCDILGIDDPVSLAMLIGGQELCHSSSLDNTASSFNNSIISSEEQSILDTSYSALQTPSPLSPQPTTEATTHNNHDSNTISSKSPLKRKSNCGLNLPKPKESASNFSICEAKIDTIKETKADATVSQEIASFTEGSKIPDDANTINAETSPNPVVRKFRRRNQNIYQNKDENNVEDEM